MLYVSYTYSTHIQTKLSRYDDSGALLNGTLYYRRYSEGCYLCLHYVPIPERSSSQKQLQQEVRRCLEVQRISLDTQASVQHASYVSRDGLLVFVPADASSVPDRVVVAGASAGSKRSIAMLEELGKGHSLHQVKTEGGRGGSSLLDNAMAALEKNQIILIEGSHTLTSNPNTNPSRLGGTGVLQRQIVSR